MKKLLARITRRGGETPPSESAAPQEMPEGGLPTESAPCGTTEAAPKPPPELPLFFMLSNLDDDGPVRLDGVKLGVCEVMGLEIDEPKLGAFTCGKAMTAAEAKSGKYTYYICHSLLKRGKGTCKTPRLNAKKFEKVIDDELRANILTESNIRDLVKLLDEEMDGVARDQRERLESIDGELEEVKKQLGRVWHFIAKSDSVDVAEASDLIVELRERKETLEVAAEEARGLLKERRQLLDSADTIATFAEEMSEFLKTSELTETRAFVHSFVKEVQVKPGRAAIIYSMPTPDDSPIGGADAAEIALNGRVMNSVLPGGPARNRTWDPPVMSRLLCR